MKLTDKAIKAAQKAEKPYKLADGGGLHLLVTKAGGKLWQYRYEVPGEERRKEKLLALGAYPGVSLVSARKAREEARGLLDKGQDPSIHRKVQRARAAVDAASTLEALARAWHAHTKDTWSERYAETVIRTFEADVFPTLGALPIRDITPRMILQVLRQVEGRTRHVARKLRQNLSAVFLYAITEDLLDTDPAQGLSRALRPVQEDAHHPALETVDDLRDLLRKIDALPASPQARLATRLLALTAVRSKELRGAAREGEFEDLDGPAPTWVIPKERMKGRRHRRREHRVPLSPAAVEVVKVAQEFAGRSPWLFPSPHGRGAPLGQSVLNRLIHSAGYEGRHTPHGWRASFSTVMNSRHRPDKEVIDLMLAHSRGNAVEAAYNRAAHMDRRRELAAEWASLLLEGLPGPREIIRLPRSGA